jgi:hypothetical protein
VVGCCESGDEPSGSCAMELISYSVVINVICNTCFGSIFVIYANFVLNIFENNYFELFGRAVITTGLVFLLNYVLSKFSK